MDMKERTFSAGAVDFSILLTKEAEQVFARFRQTGWFAREAGGQLYCADPTLSAVKIAYASPPRMSDIRRRNRFVMDRFAAEKERRHLFGKGLHCIGLWHSHPEPHPRPSQEDLEVMRETAKHAIELNAFLHIIVGTSGLWVASCDKFGVITEFEHEHL